MNKYTFSTQSGKAYYCNSIPGFIKDTSFSIVGQLVQYAFEINKDQSDAWENQISQLQQRLETCAMKGNLLAFSSHDFIPFQLSFFWRIWKGSTISKKTGATPFPFVLSHPLPSKNASLQNCKKSCPYARI